MGYRVRSEGGEVRFQTLYDIQGAMRNGLVGPEDEVTEDDREAWRKLSTIAALKDARPAPSGFWRKDARFVIPLCLLLALCLPLIFSERWRFAGLGLVLFVALLFSQFTFKVFSRRRVR